MGKERPGCAGPSARGTRTKPRLNRSGTVAICTDTRAVRNCREYEHCGANSVAFDLNSSKHL